MSAPKILVAGSVDGHFREFFGKLSEVNTKSGPFACCFCVGDFFARDTPEALTPLRDGTISGLFLHHNTPHSKCTKD